MTRQISVLIFVESKTFAMYLALLLRRMGFTPRCAASFEEADNELSRQGVDVLLLDFLPGTPALLKKFPGLPFLVVGEKDASAIRQPWPGPGCLARLDKPVQPRQLHEALQTNLSLPAVKRKNLRGTVDMEIDVAVRGHSPKTTRLLSLSRRGALLSYPRAIATGTIVSLVLPVEGDNLSLEGTVIYNLKDSADHGKNSFAVLFHRRHEQQAETIEGFLVNLLDRECREAAGSGSDRGWNGEPGLDTAEAHRMV